jgi:hypothetical protein
MLRIFRCGAGAFEKLGGPEVGAMARRRVFEGHSDKGIP